jgi:hypothetical protein
MKRFLILVGLVSTAGLASLATSAFAGVISNDTIPVSGTLTSPCNGELVVYTGTEHIIMRENGPNQVGIHINLEATAVGQTSGAEYVINAVANENAKLGEASAGDNGATTETIGVHEEFLAQGDVPNFKVSQFQHITITPDGTMRVDNTDTDTSCQ